MSFKTPPEEQLYQAVSFLMTSMGSPQERLISAAHYLEEIADIPPVIADKLADVLKRLRTLSEPGQVWAEGELKRLGDDILDMYVAVAE